MADSTEQGRVRAAIDFGAVFAVLPTPYLVMTPDLVIVDANDAYLAAVGRDRGDIVGRNVFDAFPPTPDALDENGVAHVQVSFERARDTGVPDTMPLQKYDIPDGEGGYVERYWSLISVPVLDASGATVLLLQRTEDVTDFVRERASGHAERERGAAWQRRLEEVESDLFARAAELRAALEARDVAARRLAALSDAALRLATATTIQQLTEVIIEAGTGALRATAIALGIRDESTGVLRLTASVPGVDELPLDGPLPASVAARTGDTVLLGSERVALDWSPEMRGPVQTGQRSWAALPLRTSGRLLGSLTASWSEERIFSGVERELLGAFAVQCAQALDRIQVREAEQRAATETRQLSETLQRSLLTEPPATRGMQIAVRYQPAAQEMQVGGDWYDAFVVPDGAMTLVVGDVIGHDRIAAAAMAQIRNVLRGVAQSVSEPPAAVLEALDGALRNLAVEALATAVLVQVREDDSQPGDVRTLSWSNAGHPPPLLLDRSGRAELLSEEPDLLLGVDPTAKRHDHTLPLTSGETLLLYTDGLVERRGEGLDAGLERLRAGVEGCGGLPLEQLCDDVLAMLGQDLQDDVALLAVRLTS